MKIKGGLANLEVQTAVLAREKTLENPASERASLTLVRLKSKNKTGTKVECSDA